MTDNVIKDLEAAVRTKEALHETFINSIEARLKQHRDRIEKLEAALREIAASAWDCNGKTCEHCQPNSCQNTFIARKALEENDG